MIVGVDLDPYDPRVIASSMGAEAGLVFVRAEPSVVHAWARSAGVLEVASSPRAEHAWDEVCYPARTLLWLGTERTGMTDVGVAACGVAVRIPIFGRADSLNVATAAGILVYEIVRQQRPELASSCGA